MSSDITVEDRAQFESLLRPVLDLAYRYAYRLTLDRDAALDLVQDASVIAFGSFRQFEPESNFKAWFLKILTNRYYRSRQAAARVAIVNLEDAPDLFLYRQARKLGQPLRDDPAAFVLGQADAAMIDAAMSRLADEYRVVATLHFVSQMSYEECAQTLDIPVGTVRSRLHRARRHLQVSLWQIAEERGYVSPEVDRTCLVAKRHML